MLLKKVKNNHMSFTELPKYPEVRRDLALLLDYDVPFADIRKVAYATEKKVLKEISLFDVYTGDKIPEGKKQYAINFVLQDPDKTLTDQAVEAIMINPYFFPSLRSLKALFLSSSFCISGCLPWFITSILLMVPSF